MKSLFTSLTAPALASTLIACTPDPIEPTRSVSYYQEHADERTAMVARCADDPGTLGKSPNCVNAKQAAAIEDIGSFRDLPPLPLTPKTKTSNGLPAGKRGDGSR